MFKTKSLKSHIITKYSSTSVKKFPYKDCPLGEAHVKPKCGLKHDAKTSCFGSARNVQSSLTRKALGRA